MHLTSALRSLMALAVMAPAVMATPIAATESTSVEARGIEKRSYASTCSGCQIISFTQLRCNCNKPGGGTQVSTLNLDNCLTNDNGVLKWRVGGGFSGSCYSGGFAVGTNYLTYCIDKTGQPKPTSLNLNDKIHNINGNLQCHI